MTIICPPEAISFLHSRDQRLGAAMDLIGPVTRQSDPGLFEAVVHHIVGQQISTKAQATLWARFNAALNPIDATTVLDCGRERLQALGMSWRKVDYILDFALKVKRQEFDLQAVEQMSDEQAISSLSSLRGIGVWTAEMLLLFCLRRPDILSYDDLAIRRGLRMLYRRRNIDRPFFERCRRRFTPYGSTASLYLWAIAGGAIPGLPDCPAPAGNRNQLKERFPFLNLPAAPVRS